MGRYLFVLGVVVLCTLLSGRPAAGADQTSSSPPGPAADAAQDADHAALRAMVPVYEQAVNEGKPALFLPLLDPDFSAVMVTGDEVKGATGLIDCWHQVQKMLGPDGKYQVHLNVAAPAAITPAGDMAVANGTSQENVVFSGKDMHYVGLWSAVFRKRDGQWKVLRVHASMAPVSNPFVAAIVRRQSILWGIAGVLGGIVVGWIVSRMTFGRNRPAKA